MIKNVKIVELDKSWKGRVFVYHYTTSFYYDLELLDKADGSFCFCLTKKAFEEPTEKQFEGSLFSDWLFEPVAYGAFDGDTLLGVMCLSVEDWSRRLRVAELWVDEPFRHQGVGKKLMAKAIDYARSKNLRGLVLETQSCNEPAIRFYHSCGLRFIGLDATHYSNDDILKREVRLEMGLDLPDFELGEQQGADGGNP